MATEIERAAATMLAQAQAQLQVTHPLVREYVSRLVSDPDYTASFRDSAGGQEIDQAYYDGLYEDEDRAILFAMLDRAAIRLASGLAAYRAEGRPEGDVHRDIMGMGAPLVTVTTSLAADVAAFAQDVAMAWAEALRGAQMDLRAARRESGANS